MIYGRPFSREAQLNRLLRRGFVGLVGGRSEAAAEVVLDAVSGGQDTARAGLAGGVTVNVFTAGTGLSWPNPGPGTMVRFICIGGGQGGQSGEITAAGGTAQGGTSGAGGGWSSADFQTSLLPDVLLVDVGGGGIGGAGVTAIGVGAYDAASAGGTSQVYVIGPSIQIFCRSAGPLAGPSAQGGLGMRRGGGGRQSIFVQSQDAGTVSNHGGAGGQVVATTHVTTNGQASAFAGSGLHRVSGYKPGTRDGVDGNSSDHGAAGLWTPNCGGAGGGGVDAPTAVAGHGGNGGVPGGGGGGGGGNVNGSGRRSGNGGNGGRGVVAIITFATI